MELSIWISLVAYACATTFSPGPNNVLLLSSSGQYGFKRCLPLLTGIWTGLITVMLLCGFLCSFIGMLIPQIEPYARVVGALYILYLGYKTLTKKLPADEKNEASGSADASENVELQQNAERSVSTDTSEEADIDGKVKNGAAGDPGPLKYYNGFLLQFLNVKILMLGVAAYCSFVLPYSTAVLPTLIFSCTMAACAATGNLIWITVGSLLYPIYRKYYRIFNFVMALLLLYCVYKILFV